MGKSYLGMDCGTQSVKGVVIDESKNVLAKAICLRGSDVAAACKQVLAELSEQAGPDAAAAGIVGAHKGMASALFEPVTEVLDAEAHTAGALAHNPDAKTVIVLGGRVVVLAHVKDGGVDDYDLGFLFGDCTGLFLDQKAFELNVTVEDCSDIAKTSTKPALLPARGDMPTVQDFHRMGYSDGDILMGVCKAIATRYVKNVTKKQTLEGPIILEGGLALNEAMVDAMQTKLKTDLIVPEDPAYTGALGAAILALEKGEEKPVSLADAAASTLKIKNVICANCANMCSVTGVYDGNTRLTYWGDKCGRIDPLSIF